MEFFHFHSLLISKHNHLKQQICKYQRNCHKKRLWGKFKNIYNYFPRGTKIYYFKNISSYLKHSKFCFARACA